MVVQPTRTDQIPRVARPRRRRRQLLLHLMVDVLDRLDTTIVGCVCGLGKAVLEGAAAYAFAMCGVAPGLKQERESQIFMEGREESESLSDLTVHIWDFESLMLWERMRFGSREIDRFDRAVP